ncbi:hypothetical protein AVEN_144628-1 [Araneus ventricosus]|uniref:Uncharacterized protein n=1 Tax=Araneus ventricosus TaxID=182803 RepID=A0A4Y2C1F0_ARAVE|nr:hypothetical protein AVEN_144628-1 [Araneus ventricosus]
MSVILAATKYPLNHRHNRLKHFMEHVIVSNTRKNWLHFSIDLHLNHLSLEFRFKKGAFSSSIVHGANPLQKHAIQERKKENVTKTTKKHDELPQEMGDKPSSFSRHSQNLAQ